MGPLGERYRRFVTVLELARVESFLPHFRGLPGRPVEDREALARAVIAKAVFDVPTTHALIERLETDKTPRRPCGWTWGGSIPSEATVSRAFTEFSEGALPARVHAALIEQALRCRYLTAIPALLSPGGVGSCPRTPTGSRPPRIHRRDGPVEADREHIPVIGQRNVDRVGLEP